MIDKNTTIAIIGSGQVGKSSMTDMIKKEVQKAQKNGDKIIIVTSNEMDKETISERGNSPLILLTSILEIRIVIFCHACLCFQQNLMVANLYNDLI